MNNASTFENPFVKNSELTLSPKDLEAINKGEVVEINGEKGKEVEDSVYTVIDFKTFVKLIVRSLHIIVYNGEASELGLKLD